MGSWQIIRLNWKNNLILEIENSLKNPPVELTKSKKENYLKIKTSGKIDFNKDHHFGFEAAAWYWHFVDVVWLFLFAAIYIWGS